MATKNDGTINIIKVSTETRHVCILGTNPIILNRMSEKAKHELLLPNGKKTAAQKAASLKHDPIREFRDAPYRFNDESAPTYLAFLAAAFKSATRGAAIDMPGATKAQIGRLMWMNSERVPLYGIPRLHMATVRSADMNKTPDVRTRMIVPRWALTLSLTFVSPQLNETSVVNLLTAAGMFQGVGDWRPEKGSGNFGQFSIVPSDDPEFLDIVKNGGRAAQLAAIQNPVAYDEETESLLEWFVGEADRRGKVVSF